MRWLLALALVAGCAPSLPASYQCTTDAQCFFRGAQGRCEATGACSFPDASCSDGRRYGELGPPSLAGMCVEDAMGGDDLGGSDLAGSDLGGGHITRVGSTSVPTANRSSVALPAPTGLQSGDVVVACVFSPDGQATIAPPNGWSPHADLHGAIGGEFRALYFVYVAGPAEPATWTFTLGGTSSTTAAAVAYRGVDGTHPVDVSTTNQFEGAAFIAPSITTTQNGDELVTLFVQAQNQSLTWKAPTGMDVAVDASAVAIFDVSQPAAGATGDKQATLGGLSLPGIGAVDYIALQPK
jgi:hypothetical protein